MKRLQILIITLLITLSIIAFASIQAVAALPTVTIAPLGPITLDLGQSQTLTATPAGGFGSYSIQWYVDGSLQSSTLSSFSYSPASLGSHTIYATATDLVTSEISNPSNIVTVTVNSGLVAPTVSASVATVNQGQTSSLTSSAVSTGTSPYTYQWLQKVPDAGSYSAISGATSSSYSFVTSGSTAAGSWSFELQVTDSASTPVIITSAAASVTVKVPPTVSVSPGSAILDVGQSQLFTATPSGGSGSYTSYQWYVGGVVQSGATSSTFSYSPSSSGSPLITVTVTDSLGTISAPSSAPSLTVAVSPTVSIAPVGSVKMDVGQVQVFTAAPSGGSGTIHYQWYLDSSTVGTDSTNYSYTAAGTSHSVTCKVTDTASTPVTSLASNAVSVTVNVAPTISVAPASWTMNVGQSKTFTATASGGTGTLSYQWYLAGSAVSGQTGLTYAFTAVSVGSPTIYCKVTDQASIPVVVQSNAVSVAVNAVPTVSLLPVSWVMDVGQSKTFTASASGGSGSYASYQWYVGGVVQSGATSSTFSYSPSSSGSPLITVTVTDSLGTISAPSSAPSLTVAVSPTVSIAPVGSVKMDVGQVQVFTAAPSGGSGTIHYQWYLDSSTVGTDSTNYSYTAAGTSHSVTCKVTDTASTPVTSLASNAVSITVNPALLAPTISASVGTINQGQTTGLTSTAVSTGTSPYTYQWLQKAPGGSYARVGSNSPSFSFVTSGSIATGSWSFIVQVTDFVGAAVNSSAVTVTVNTAPLDHFVFSSVGVQTAGVPFSITITAKNAFNNTLTNYSGTNILNVSIGTVSPTITGVFSNGVWTGSVTVTGAGSGIWLITAGSSMSGTSNTFAVNPGVLDHFSFNTISAQIVDSSFGITVTAMDAFGNIVVSYVDTPSLTYSAGSISPTAMTAFVGGVGSTSVKVTAADSSATITVVDGSRAGISNQFAVTLAPTPTPTPSPSPNPTTPITKPTPTATPKPSTAPTSTPLPTPTPSTTNVMATTDSGAEVDLAINGNITSSQMSNVTITTNPFASTTTLSFIVTGESGTTGFSNITIPKTAITYGTNPVVYIEGQPARNQGYIQDANNFYVWYITQFSTHRAKIQFTTSSTSQETFGPMLVVTITVIEIISIFTVISVRRLKRRPDNA